MMSGSVSCGRYMTGLTYSRSLWRPRWCTRTIGAPSKFPPTLPSFARNCAMVLAFQSSASLMSNSCRSRSRVCAGTRLWKVRRPFSLGGDTFCAGEMCRQELSGLVQCRGRFVEDRVVGLEDVRYSGGNVEGDLDVGRGGLPGEADGVVQEDLVGSGLDDQGRQAGQVGEDGADEAEGGVVSRRVVGDPGLEGLWAEQRVSVAFGLHGAAGQGEVGVR